jgi:hypothetical protein
MKSDMDSRVNDSSSSRRSIKRTLPPDEKAKIKAAGNKPGIGDALKVTPSKDKTTPPPPDSLRLTPSSSTLDTVPKDLSPQPLNPKRITSWQEALFQAFRSPTASSFDMVLYAGVFEAFGQERADYYAKVFGWQVPL